MNFFDAQDQARRSSRRLVFVYIIAVSIIVIGVTLFIGFSLYGFTDIGRGISPQAFLVQFAPMLLGIAFIVALVIGMATAYKTASLSSGGSRVAADVGGTLVPPDTQDPLRRRLRNVVEEMAIASGVPVPDIFVLEQESGINAFAAGFEPGDAAVAVTRGTLELLDRDELQGVIAHEFSHILNGDMRLNIRLMGVLFGIMVLSLAGRMILRGGRWGAFSRRSDRGAPVVLIIALGLTVLGGIGMFFARIIKSGVSRQREYLADASAVQFTRQTSGIANALKKIGGYQAGSHLQATDPEEVSHMLFGTGSKLGGLFATHPPLTERIQALDPHFKSSDYPVVKRGQYRAVSGDARSAGFDSGVTTAMATGTTTDLTETIAGMVGDPEPEHVLYATELRRSIPESLYDAAHSHELAYLLCISLVLDRSGEHLERQLGIATERLGQERVKLVEKFFDEIQSAGAEYRLPMLEIAFPALKRRPEPELSFLIDLAGRLIDADGDIDLYEYCYYRILVSNLTQAVNPSTSNRRSKTSRKPVRNAAIELLRIVARHGHPDREEQERAFLAGTATFGKWGSEFVFDANHEYAIPVLDESLELLLALNGDGKRMLLEAITAVVMSDNSLTVAETELIRAICASLDCPLPPILVSKPE
jgi:Zn-dependent protease with chaperone function